jgi:DNA modification methylase
MPPGGDEEGGEIAQKLDIPEKPFHCFINADVMDGLSRLPDESIEVVITSQPYRA